MQIKRHNMDKNRVFETSGPNVEFEVSDTGSANVSITLRLSDGTFIHYPTGAGRKQLASSMIPPGEYGAVVTISAAELENFGRGYDSLVTIGGKKAISAKGTIPSGQPVDQDFELFVLRVG